MINLEGFDDESAATVFIISNNASYLYVQLRSEPGVSALASHNSARELWDFVVANSQNAELELSSVVRAYSAIVALTLKGYREVVAVVDRSLISGLPWAGKLLDAWDSLRISVVSASMTIPPILSSAPVTQNTNALNTGNTKIHILGGSGTN